MHKVKVLQKKANSWFFLFVCFVLMILLNKFQFWVYSMHSKCMIVFVRSSQTYNKKVWSSSKYIISLVRTVSINAFYPHMLCILIITVYFAKNNDFSMAMIFEYLQLDLALICPPLKEFDKMWNGFFCGTWGFTINKKIQFFFKIFVPFVLVLNERLWKVGPCYWPVGTETDRSQWLIWLERFKWCKIALTVLKDHFPVSMLETSFFICPYKVN